MTLLPFHSTRHRLAVSLLTPDERKRHTGRAVTPAAFRNLDFQDREFKQGVCAGGGLYYWEREKGIATWRENYYAPATVVLNIDQIRDALNEVAGGTVQLQIF